jgi:hypothetical protein
MEAVRTADKILLMAGAIIMLAMNAMVGSRKGTSMG